MARVATALVSVYIVVRARAVSPPALAKYIPSALQRGESTRSVQAGGAARRAGGAVARRAGGAVARALLWYPLSVGVGDRAVSVCAESGGSEMSAGSGGGEERDGRRPSTCRVELGALLAPEPRPLDNKVKVCFTNT